MSPEERDLIVNLFDRIRDAGAIDKDRQAETLIRDAVRQLPDAPYVLVQSVLLQESALAEAQSRIEELQARVADLEAEAQPQQTSRGGGFLAGRAPLSRGGGSASVPSVSTARQAEPQPEPATRGVWGSSRPAEPGVPPGRGPAYQPSMPPMPSAPPAPQSGGGGGFFRSALAAAAGVAGGVMLSDALKGMMGGSSGEHQASGEPHYQNPADNDPGVTHHAADDTAPADDGWDSSDDSIDA